ncbi:MAG TPA: anaerobic sulfatase maturase [Dehalococcoidia bacterium]|nr:anaerobic sulfatase maturase [Dehalococcoidia bacterium]
MCNLDCKYCFYLEKENLYPDKHRWQMPDDVLESYVRQYIEAQSVPEIQFAWQGGEPTLLGVGFFRKVVELQARYAGGKRIANAFQTNGTLLDDEWGEFLREHNFLVGLSIDGPRDLHDVYRVDKRQRPTFDDVMRGLAFLKKHGVEFNTLTVVNRANSQHPLRVYRFLKEIGSGFIQFIPLVERAPAGPAPAEDLLQLTFAAPPLPAPLQSAEGRRQKAEGSRDSSVGLPSAFCLLPSADRRPPTAVTEWSVRGAQYGEFLVQIFDEWVRHDVGKTFVQIFDVALGNWAGMGSGLCVFAEKCGLALALEHNGDLYSCDHYVYPQYKLGNLMNESLAAMVHSPEQRQFGDDKSATLPRYCRECEVRFACNGECPKHRFLHTPDGEEGLNYLCAGYKRFFNHIDPHMQTMTRLLRARRAPAEIMDLLRQQQEAARRQNPGRNDSCPCGSGRKFKKCCGA